MHVLIIGAAGMLGAKLASQLAQRGTLNGIPIHHLTLADQIKPTPPAFNGAITCLGLDIAQPASAAHLIKARPEVIFHLAAIVSGQAEAEFATGYAINFDASRALFEAIRLAPSPLSPYTPRLIFASSIAVFGTPFPAQIPDDFHTTPRSSYGSQKACTELLLSDYSRRGFIDGIALRLPTICIRPGQPNRAASGFYSNILREPLAGKPANLPVPDSTRHWFTSPRSAVGFFVHAAGLSAGSLGPNRVINMPGLSATVAEQIEALRAAAGQAAVNLITRIDDPTIAALVQTWPQDFAPRRAEALGFTAETGFDQIVAAHLKDELGGVPPKPHGKRKSQGASPSTRFS